MKFFLSAILSLLGVPAAAITVTTPVKDAWLYSPFRVAASTTTCGGIPAVSMGYSIDDQIATIVSTSFHAIASASPGKHVLHVKCWGVAVHDEVLINFTIVAGAFIPVDAQRVSKIQRLPGWQMVHDPGTPGTAQGAMTMVATPSISGLAARFDTGYTNWGGVLYSVTYGSDPSPHHFVYDAQVWIANGSQLSNLELDNNQVTADGHTIIYAFQCAGNSNRWEYTENAGTPSQPVAHWIQSDQYCNPLAWTPNRWHHVEVSYSRDDAGNVTYHSVWLDGVESQINRTVNSDFSLRWATVLIANFQIDGLGASGASTLYLDNLTLYRW